MCSSDLSVQRAGGADPRPRAAGAGSVPGLAATRGAFAAAYRAWATSQPHRYRLLFGAPIPGFAAHSERLIAAAQRSMDSLLAILVDLDPTCDTGTQRPVNLDSQLRAWASRVGANGVAPPALWRDGLLKGP